jgi:phosphohistidine phosphatase
MARQLWLLRHGEAVPHDNDDDARELTERGREQALAAGGALARLEIPVHLCFTSPKVRALQTAQLACEALGVEPVVHEALGEGFDLADAMELMAASAGDQRVLVVGHEPDFSQVVHDVTGARVELKKGGLAGVRFDSGRHGKLLVLLRPRELHPIAG